MLASVSVRSMKHACAHDEASYFLCSLCLPLSLIRSFCFILREHHRRSFVFFVFPWGILVQQREREKEMTGLLPRVSVVIRATSLSCFSDQNRSYRHKWTGFPRWQREIQRHEEALDQIRLRPVLVTFHIRWH